MGSIHVTILFSHGAKASSWKLNELLRAMYKICDESPSRRADYETLTAATEKDYAIKFYSHWWIEKESVARRVQKVSPKYPSRHLPAQS